MLKESGNILTEQIKITKDLLDFCLKEQVFICPKTGNYSKIEFGKTRAKNNDELSSMILSAYEDGILYPGDFYKTFGFKNQPSFMTFLKATAIKSGKQFKRITDLYPTRVLEKMRATSLERYGVENAMQAPEIRGRIEATFIKKYGVKNPMQSPEVQKKKEQTNVEKYGAKTPLLNLKVREKSKATCIEKYGVENPFASGEIKLKIRQTNLEKFGVEIPAQSPEIRKKMERTTLERYGVRNLMQSPEIRKKVEQTNLERYGVSNVLYSPEFRERIWKTNLERYGAANPFASELIKERIAHTNLQRYGVKFSTQSQEIQNKIEHTNLQRYGVKSVLSTPEIQSKRYQDNADSKDPVASGYSLDFLKERHSKISKIKASPELFDANEVQDFLFSYYSQPHRSKLEVKLGIRDPYKSSLEVKVCGFLDSLGVEYETNDRKILGGLELDIWIPDRKVAIEINGIYWHSSVFKEKKYHQSKKLAAMAQGISLMMFTEDQIYERFDIVCSIIQHRLGLTPNKIPARKCEVREISFAEASAFLNENHLDGRGSGSKYHFGLFYGGVLVQVATVGSKRFGQKRVGFELIRSATKLNTLVSGGFQKLIKFFKTTKEFKEISSNPGYAGFESYVDANVFDAKSYGGSDVLTEPDLWFVSGVKRFKRQKFMKHNLHKLFPEFPQRGSPGYEGIDANSFLKSKGIFEYYGCGNFKVLI